jgi:hypothetical protein
VRSYGSGMVANDITHPGDGVRRVAVMRLWMTLGRAFLESNRLWENAPLLVVEHGRLQREVLRRESVLTALLQSLEQARIAEVRDTPVITVLQAPFLPPGPDERRLLLAAALGIVLGGMAGVVMAFVIEAVRRPSEGDPAREDFQESWDGLVRSIPLVGRRGA